MPKKICTSTTGLQSFVFTFRTSKTKGQNQDAAFLAASGKWIFFYWKKKLGDFPSVLSNSLLSLRCLQKTKTKMLRSVIIKRCFVCRCYSSLLTINLMLCKEMNCWSAILVLKSLRSTNIYKVLDVDFPNICKWRLFQAK